MEKCDQTLNEKHEKTLEVNVEGKAIKSELQFFYFVTLRMSFTKKTLLKTTFGKHM